MKKVLVLLLSFFIAGIVYASEPCEFVSGDGTNIGDEIACGSEHFYVMSNDGNKIKMMAKYNLLVGDVVTKTYYDFTDFEAFRNYLNSEDSELYRFLGSRLEFRVHRDSIFADKYAYGYGFDETKNKFFVITGEKIKKDHVLQDATAIGFKGEYKNNDSFPFTGVIDRYLYTELIPLYYRGDTMPSLIDPSYFENIPIDSEGYVKMINYPFEKTITQEMYDDYLRENNITADDYAQQRFDRYHDHIFVADLFTKYENELNTMGLEEVTVDMPTIEDIDELVKKISNKNLDINSYRASVLELVSQLDDSLYNDYALYHLDNLKSYLPEKYAWIYGTTYYTKTMFFTSVSWDANVVLISTAGDVCVSGTCSSVNPFIAGFRPVVTINAVDIKNSSHEYYEEENKNPETKDIVFFVGIIFVISIIYTLISYRRIITK